MKLVDAQALAILLRVPAATIRQWARRGKLTRQGHDSKGRTLYDINEARTLSSHPKQLDASDA